MALLEEASGEIGLFKHAVLLRFSSRHGCRDWVRVIMDVPTLTLIQPP